MEWRFVIAAAGAALALAAPAAAAPPTPIAETPTTTPPPAYFGAPATPQPISLTDAPPPPRHPFMAPNDRSNIHDDAYQTDTADGPGPLGRDMQRVSTQQFADCASVTFDSRGRIETVCVGIGRITLKLFDPRTLEELASFDLPPRSPSLNVFTDFSGGGYFYLDNRDRALVVTSSRHLFLIGQTGGGTGFALQRDYDLSAAVSSDDKFVSTLPDFSGRLWIVSVKGTILTLDPANGKVQSLATGEPIGNSFAVDETGGVFIVTDKAMYRFDADRNGEPRVTWREVYDNTGGQKPGQTEHGSGTTPTLMGSRYVSITDNADPIDVVVYQRGKVATGSRKICTQPVFDKGASSTDNSLIGTARSMVVENNYGYTGPTSTMGGATSQGVDRVDVDAGGHDCHRVWHSTERSPTVVPKLSLENGLVYLYTKEPDPNRVDPFYLTAVDFRTGKTVYKQLAGYGLGFNNNYAPVSLGPDGTAYVGTLGGLVALRDRVAPGHTQRPGPAALRRPRLRLALHGLVRPRRRARCAHHSVRAVVTGRDRALVKRVDFLLGARRIARDSRAPFSKQVRRRGLATGRRYRLRARVSLRDGRKLTLRRRFRAC